MDIITQLQEQLNTIAMLAVNTFGTLQRDAPPVRLSPDYPEPPSTVPNPGVANQVDPAAATAPAAAAGGGGADSSSTPAPDIDEQTSAMSSALVDAAKKFDALVAALPLSGEDEQLKRIAELQAENEAVGQELQKQLEAAELELKQAKGLFSLAADSCLNLKKLD